MQLTTLVAAALGLKSMASAHMLLSYPPAFRYEGNPNVPSGSVDYSLTAPLDASGSNFPCKGYQSDLGSPAGASVATWAAGGTYNFTIGGSAAHGGGSCQAALSYDKGKTFTVIHSYVGGCPTTSPAGGSFDFTIPADAPTGAAMFAWTWFNHIGNREMYMDCASITITGASKNKRAATAFTSRPSLFVANLGNGCTTIETTDTTFPDPGPDVTDVTSTPGGVTGTCKAVAGIGDFTPASGGGSGSSAASPASSPVSGGTPPSSAAGGSYTAMTSAGSGAGQPSGSYSMPATNSAAAAATAAATAASPTSKPSGGLSPSSDGSCGGSFGCEGSIHGGCCSEWGWCGSTDAYCGTGCQSAFGSCGSSKSSPSSALTVSTDKTCGGSTSNTCQGSSYGNCCSQYGYCGSTSDYCGTGCQSGFGSCGASESSPASGTGFPPSSQAVSSLADATGSEKSSAAASSTKTVTNTMTSTKTMSPYFPTSNSSGYPGATISGPTMSPSGFVTMTKPKTSSPAPDLVTIIPITISTQTRLSTATGIY